MAMTKWDKLHEKTGYWFMTQQDREIYEVAKSHNPDFGKMNGFDRFMYGYHIFMIVATIIGSIVLWITGRFN